MTRKWSLDWRAMGLAWLAIPLMLIGAANAAPAVQQASGVLNHGATITLSGSGFGTKPTAAPVVWDDASGASLADKWDGYWPSNNASYNAAYRSPIRGIGLPHGNVSRYIAGAHAENKGSSGGYNVGMWKHRSLASYPQFTYVSWYQRADDNWVFGLGDPADDNYKCFSIDDGTDTPFSGSVTSNLEYNARPTSRSSVPSWHIYDGGGTRFGFSGPTGVWGASAVNPMAGAWSKVEVETKHSTGSDGYFKVWENGVLKVNFSGKTANSSDGSMTIGIGGYSRAYGNSNNWRYFSDVYLDFSPARVVLANNANLASATIIEPQIPTRWTDSSIDVKVNLGKFSSGQTAYLFVVNGSAERSASGLPVTVGASAGGSVIGAPSPPSGVTVE